MKEQKAKFLWKGENSALSTRTLNQPYDNAREIYKIFTPIRNTIWGISGALVPSNRDDGGLL